MGTRKSVTIRYTEQDRILGYIYLTTGERALISQRDFTVISKFKWHRCVNGHLTYARTVRDGVRTSMQDMVARLAGIQGMVDHRDGDGLNNRRSNLRSATRQQNCQNTRKAVGRKCTSQYKGVAARPGGRWIVRIKVGDRVLTVGNFKIERCAAKAYDRAARKYFGEFARLNFPLRRGEFPARTENTKIQPTISSPTANPLPDNTL